MANNKDNDLIKIHPNVTDFAPNPLIKRQIEDLLQDNYYKLVEYLDSLPPKDFIRFYIELLKFTTPRYGAINLNVDINPDKHSEDEVKIRILNFLKNGKNKS